MKLTVKQEKFCQEYVKNGNASESYRNAYSTVKMKDKTINEKASRMLKEDKISTRVKELKDNLSEEHEITKNEIVKELHLLITTKVTKKSVVRNQDKLKAIEIASKMFGLNEPTKSEAVVSETTKLPDRFKND